MKRSDEKRVFVQSDHEGASLSKTAHSVEKGELRKESHEEGLDEDKSGEGEKRRRRKTASCAHAKKTT